MSKIFWYHYNKPKSRELKKVVISVHYDRACHLVDNVVVGVPTAGKIRKTQPYFVVRGRANKIEIIDGVAHIS